MRKTRNPPRMVLLQVDEMPVWLRDLFTSEWALVVLLGICVLEGLMLLRFLPSELVVPSALALIGSSVSDVVAILAIAVVGTTVGQCSLFLVVRRGGRQFVCQRRWFPIDEGRLDRFDAWFDRWGVIALPLSNTMLLVRGLLSFPAGLSDMHARQFVALSALGTTVFQTILAGLFLYAERTLV